MKKPLLITTLTFLATINPLVLPLPMMVNGSATAASRSPSLSSKLYVAPQPPDTGTPNGRTHGGSRGGCNASDEAPPLTALVPATKINKTTGMEKDVSETSILTRLDLEFEQVWSYTTDARPTLWFYSPYELDGTTNVSFVLEDNAGNSYEHTFQPVTTAGIVSVTIPETVPELRVGDHYRWLFSMHCLPEEPDFVEGWVYRMEPDASLNAQISAATPQEQARLYAQNGIWQNALTRLAQLRQLEPDNEVVMTDWRSLLESVGLEVMAEEPFTDCCSTSES